MPNFQSGTLFASSGDVYTQLMDVIKAYMEARGWTSNVYEDYRFKYAGDDYVSKRLHAQKTINSIDRFINIRSMKNQRIFSDITNLSVTGIGIIGSTGFGGATTSDALTLVNDAGGFARFYITGSNIYATVGDTITVSGTGVPEYDTTHIVTSDVLSNRVITSTPFVSGATGTITWPSRWDGMSGYTHKSSTDSDSAGAGAIDLPVNGLSYFLFSENSGDNIYMIFGNSTGYSGIAFGVTSTGNYFVSGATTVLPSSSQDVYTNMFFTLLTAGSSGSLALRKRDDSDWYGWPVESEGAIAVSMVSVNVSTGTRSPADQLLFCSPDNFKGNNPLIPLYMGKLVTSNKFISAGVVPGIKYVNMKFMASLTELTFGGDVYKLFRLYTEDDSNDATIGLAFLK